tara:strand:+ start:4144 stop:5388 length:1245 start_codon:yes stop_codon:yes gene_type:complete
MLIDDRWNGIRRDYTAEDVERLRGSIKIEHTLAARGADRLWSTMKSGETVRALGALTGNQAVQQARAGLNGVYVSGWQVAADNNLSGHTYPDQSLYPANSVPSVVKKINQALQRADQIESSEGEVTRDWFVPVVADAEAGFGGPLNAFEMMKSMIEAGAAGVHFEDQLSSEKKCGHLGGKVLIPTSHFIRTLKASRLAADISGTSTVLIARTDANSAKLITSDIDEEDQHFIRKSGHKRTPEGFFRIPGGLDIAIDRGLSYAPYADMIWCETSTPSIDEAREFANAIHDEFPGKMLAYNCSPSFNWSKHLTTPEIREFQDSLSEMGYMFQFVTLAGFHSLNMGMFDLARDYGNHGMLAYSRFQNHEFNQVNVGYTAVKHQREVGTGYFDDVSSVISGGTSSTTAMGDSTESHQF